MRDYHQKKLNAEALYDFEPWQIIENDYKVENNHHNESIFSLGNGQMGIRGTLEEDYSGPEDTTTPGFYINGVYGSKDIIYGEKAPNQPEKSQTILNLTDWTRINLYIDGEKFDMLSGTVSNYERILNMKEGTLTRKLIWKSPEGKKVYLKIIRFISLVNKNLAVINYNLTPLNFSGKITLISSIKGNIRNKHFLTDDDVVQVRDTEIINKNNKSINCMIQQIESTDINVGLGMINQLNVKEDIINSAKFVKNKEIINKYTIQAEKNKNISLTKYISVYHSEVSVKDQLKEKIINDVYQSSEAGYQQLLEEHQNYLQEYWEDVDVRIVGDMSLQQAFRFNAFHILQSTGRDGKTNAPAKGLTGEFYEGHYFWDTETYILPFFLYSRPEFAKQLLIYRYNILEEARENAKRVRLKGALFPWRTINGKEASAFFMGSTVQFHINADIAFAIKQYFTATEDYGFMYDYGIEILMETARMWASRGSYIPLKDNKYCFNEVCGPDEYKPGVNNNCYNNYMAKFNLEYAAKTVNQMKNEAPDKYKKIKNKLDIEQKEIDNWVKLAEDIYLPYNEELGIHPQDDTFLFKDDLDLDSIPHENFPLVKNWHPLTIWRYQVIKQADVILLMLLLNDKFTLEQKKANYDFYEPKTTHDSSLSPSVYSIIASEVGYCQEAFDYFVQTARLDLDDFNENTYKGIHLACMGSTWLSFVQGFAGMRVKNETLHFKPDLPDKWDGYEFKIKFKDNRIKIRVEEEIVLYQLMEGKKVELIHDTRKIKLDNKENIKKVVQI